MYFKPLLLPLLAQVLLTFIVMYIMGRKRVNEINKMKIHLVTVLLLLVPFVSQSKESAEISSTLTATNLSSISINSDPTIIVENDIVPRKKRKKYLNTNKQVRLELGEDIMNIGGDIGIFFGDNLWPVGLTLASPFIVAGAGFMIWGALTPKYSRARK